ncbi:MAG TPA: alpha-amylase family glycosyl hydrolase [Ignavibacteriaceae bacterium]|nr:alpha-amylase family glycosyl hydrolase [Ignavibacteriaceae bacterium]
MLRKFKLLISLSILFITLSQAQQVNSVKHPDWSRNLSIYEVNTRQYTPEGTFQAFDSHIQQLKDLGVGIVWFMPINPIGQKNRKGSLGSYYSVKDYKAVNPEFGTLADFKETVKEIHKMGMYVIIDWVANHTAWDNVWVTEHPDFYTKDSLGSFMPPVADWHDVIDLNYDNKELWKYMIDAMKYWVQECDIDGFRCDVAGMVPLEFWKAARTELDKVKAVFMLAEAEGPDLHEAFDMTYSWELLHLMNDVAQEKKGAQSLRDYFEKEKNKYPVDAYRMRFTTNHDENSWNGTVFERMGEAVETFDAFTCVIRGMPLVYSGQEAGLNKRLNFFDKDTIEWKDSKYRILYSGLLHEKEKNKALWNGEEGGGMIPVEASSGDVIAFVRQKDNDKMYAVFNLSSKSVKTELESNLIRGEYINLLSGKETKIKSREWIELKPWTYRILITK